MAVSWCHRTWLELAVTRDGVLEVDGLTKRFGDIDVLAGASFEVRAGELFGFVDSNGAGKTTTLRIVMGVVAADGGKVRWQGVPLAIAARRRFGYLPEERGLYPTMRLGEQIVYLARLHGIPAAQARAAARTGSSVWVSGSARRTRCRPSATATSSARSWRRRSPSRRTC